MDLNTNAAICRYLSSQWGEGGGSCGGGRERERMRYTALGKITIPVIEERSRGGEQSSDSDNRSGRLFSCLGGILPVIIPCLSLHAGIIPLPITYPILR